ncbi:MAG TPA: hypothetical protein VFS20_28375 [Longimicrobium sp.]|nr:hypothetical protein [Longimicrobium sp.]
MKLMPAEKVRGRVPNHSRWQDIPLDVLRGFIEELRLRHTDRGVAKIAGLSRSAVRDFAMGRTQPERRTLRAFGGLYIQFAGRSDEKVPTSMPPLKSVLPEGEEAAQEYITEVIRAAEAAGTLPQSPWPLGEWLSRRVAEEHHHVLPLRRRRQRRTLPVRSFRDCGTCRTGLRMRRVRSAPHWSMVLSDGNSHQDQHK